MYQYINLTNGDNLQRYCYEYMAENLLLYLNNGVEDVTFLFTKGLPELLVFFLKLKVKFCNSLQKNVMLNIPNISEALLHV